MKNFLSVLGAFALMLFSAAMPVTQANAAGATGTFSAGINSPRQPGQALVCDFDTTCLDKLTGNYGIVQGTTAAWAAPQLLNTSNFLVVPGTGARGVAQLDLAWLGPLKSISFEWGSVDLYNSLQIALASGPVFTLSGSNVVTANYGSQTNPTANGVFDLVFDEIETVLWFRLISTDIAFEFDNVYAETVSTGAVPEPASWAMMIVGFGIVGLARRRQRAANDNGQLIAVAA